jgi:hypothetical protein
MSTQRNAEKGVPTRASPNTDSASRLMHFFRLDSEPASVRRVGSLEPPARLAEPFSLAKSKTGFGHHAVDENLCAPNGVTQT